MRQRLAVLDGLRGIAILLVLWFHLWQTSWLSTIVPLPGGRTANVDFLPQTGFTGVDLFFFISGFCLFYPYARTVFDGFPAQTLPEFAWRRAIKILPSYVLLIAFLIAVGDADGVHGAGQAVRQIALHLTFVHNWFGDAYGAINGVLWSLGVEVQFYVLFPLLCRFALRRPAIAFPALFAEALIYRAIIAQDQYGIGARINQLPAVLDLFAAGMLCAYAYRWIDVRKAGLARRRWFWTGLALAGGAATLWLLHDLFGVRLASEWSSNWYVGHRTLLAAAFVALTLGSLLGLPLWQRAVANPALVFLSVISYNLYLWHTVVLQALRAWGVPQWSGTDPHADQTWQWAFTVVASVLAVAVAAAITYAVERPLLKWRPLRQGEVSAAASLGPRVELSG